MTLRSKTQNLRYLKHLYFFLLANEQINFQEFAGTVLFPLTDLIKQEKPADNAKEARTKKLDQLRVYITS